MEVKTVGGIPVECLTGELAGVWSGWRTLGDREVVREASAKGTHIKLAQRFLADRRQCSLDEAQIYFDKEVDVWVQELLGKLQVHRASHILHNVGKCAKEYIAAICVRSKNPKLQEYLVQHLIKVNGFHETQVEAWNIINFINKYKKKCLSPDIGSTTHKSIEEIMQLAMEIKLALCTEIYFHIYDPTINEQLQNSVVWNYLLMTNRYDMICFCIDMNYSSSLTDNERINENINNNVKNILSNLKITKDMVQLLDKTNIPVITSEFVLNYLSRYGVFMEKEQENISQLLARFFNNGTIPEQFHKILSFTSCNINENDFMGKLDIRLYSRNYMKDNKKEESDIKNEKLSKTLNSMCVIEDSLSDALQNGIIATIKYISNNPNQFFKDNYLITFVVVFLQYGKKLGTLIHNEGGIDVKKKCLQIFMDENDLNIADEIIPKEMIQEALSRLPHLKQAMRDDCCDKNEVTSYQLLDGFKNFHATQAFKWRQKVGCMPNFSNENISKKYGHNETFSYLNYLKEARPHMAATIVKQQQDRIHGYVSSKTRSQSSLDIHIFGLKHLKETNIVCSCISFMEILGMNSESLRLHIAVANYVQEKLNISIGSFLEAALYNNQKELNSILSYLELSYHSCLNMNIMNDATKFVESLKIWDVIVRFAKLHDTSLPVTLLQFLAKNNFWFEYILVGHIFAYPEDQVLENVKQFENANLWEHLLTCLNNSQLLKPNAPNRNTQKLKLRDSRQLLYSKIGLKQHDSPGSSTSSVSTDTSSSLESYTGNFENFISNYDNFIFPNDLWLIILKCHQSQDPPGSLLNAARLNYSPILTVLATCYEPSSSAAYWCFWLVMSVENEEFLSEYEDCLQHQIWSAAKVLHLIQSVLARGYIDSLNRSLEIFMPENPLCPFIKFLRQCVHLGDFKSCKDDLVNFKAGCSNLKCNKMINWDSPDVTYLENAYWIATVAVKCILAVLNNCFRSSRCCIEFLDLLIKCDFSTDLPVSCPNFECLLELVTILFNTDITLDFSAFDIKENNSRFDKEIERCINDLLKIENYKSALLLSKAANADCSKIILAQHRSELKRTMKKGDTIDTSFWKRCATDFKEYNVCHESAAEFFIEYAERVTSYKERYEILKLAFETLRHSATNRQTIDTVEMAMWKSCILAGPSNIELEYEDNIFSSLKTELLSGLSTLQVSCKLNDPAEKCAVEALIDRFLDVGRLDTALRINSIFNCKHSDLQVLMLCLSLAEGEVSPYKLTAQQRMLLSKSNKIRQQKHSVFRTRGLQKLPSSNAALMRVSSSSSFHSESSEVMSASSTISERQMHLDCTRLLERLVETLKHGVATGSRIILCHRLAIYSGRSYESLLTLDNPRKILQEIIDKNCEHKMEVIADIIAAYQINNQDVACFLAEKIFANITMLVKGEADELMAIWGYPLDNNFHLIIELCSEPTLLGMKLLEKATMLLGRSHGNKRDGSTLKIIVELLIRSHDCFTASCNMEGIASILRKCQHLAVSLQNLKQWSLLILKENDQFEFLLGKGLDKVPGLKMALLEFVKRQCPENKDLFNLVALHFRLYHEIALMWEREAKETINELVAITKNYSRGTTSFQNNIRSFMKSEIVEKKLQLTMANLTHATQYYLQDNKSNLAIRCSHQAQLVALQLSLFVTALPNQHVVCILNLNTDEIDKVICQSLSFSQALILERAYNHHADWAGAIYTHCIVNGETKYLKEFMMSNVAALTVAVRDCAKRYQLEKSITKQMAENMQVLISQLSDIECKYMLASQLGFKPIIESMLANSSINSYLKDDVWRKGYNTP
ncbi:spatacsin isoform X2 [Cephus cinctus]|uniref:Spatacsin isoform X2 n=1 Tax=Cephus cinctus TaxID=211228 RepID=A0AAJ7RBC4_CEPCN|nr:spatacsin isoform X2 [Cephus cinctus]